MIPPTSPYRGIRGVDDFGSGSFMADRIGHKHKGIDFAAEEGDSIVSPCNGIVTKIGIAYAGSNLGSIHMQTGNYDVKLLYAKPMPEIKIGVQLMAGDHIAVAQNVATYHMNLNPNKGIMINHVHLEIRDEHDEPINPLSLIPSLNITDPII